MVLLFLKVVRLVVERLWQKVVEKLNKEGFGDLGALKRAAIAQGCTMLMLKGKSVGEVGTVLKALTLGCTVAKLKEMSTAEIEAVVEARTMAKAVMQAGDRPPPPLPFSHSAWV